MQRMTVSAWMFALGLGVVQLHGQLIETVAGTAWVFPTANVPALSAPLGNLGGVAVDAQGNVYASDSADNIVVRISPSGVLTVVAGNGNAGFSGDQGPASSASLSQPTGVAVDSAGNLYIADLGNNRIRMVSANGTISTVAGNGGTGFSDGVPATNTSLSGPSGVAVDSAGNLYIADFYNNRIRKVSGGTITTVAGNGNQGYSGDGGLATSATLNGPQGVVVDSTGNLYIADQGNNRVRKVSGGTIATVAGNNNVGFSGDGGPGTSASLNGPAGLALDSAGTLYIADQGNNRIRKVSGGTIATVAGNGAIGFSGDGGPAIGASLNGPDGVALDSAGNLYVADSNNERVRKVSGGTIATFAGNGAYRFSGDGGPAISASLDGASGIAVGSAGTFYIADPDNNRIRKVSGGTITTVAGNGFGAFSGDGGPATSASLHGPVGVAVDAAGNLYIADTGNNRIRKVSGGTITTVAGNGKAGSSGDAGPATSASLNGPVGLAVDSSGNLYVADAGNNRIRKVAGGTITTVAGGGASALGDGGPATSASLNDPIGVAVDSAGNLYIADSNNARIRKVSGGTISTVAGNGTAGFSGDGGAAGSASLSGPAGAVVDSAGTLYIADNRNNRIRKVSGGTIATVAGNGTGGFSGDGGPAASASLNGPYGVAVDSNGNLYIADQGNNRIREVFTGAIIYQATPASLSFTASAGGSAAAAQTISLTSPLIGLSFTVSTNAPWLSVSPSSGSMPATVQVTADPSSFTTAVVVSGVITFTASIASPATVTVPVTFTVTPPIPPTLSVDTMMLSFTALQGGANQTAQVQVSNAGAGSFSFTAVASNSSGGTWLSVSPGSGVATHSSSATLTVTANIGSLGPGTYQGSIVITGAGSTWPVSVTLSVTPAAAVILLSQTGLSFRAAAQGGAPLPQSFGILNTGTGSMSWSASATTVVPGETWLQISPTSGAVNTPFLDVSLVNVTVDPSGLAPGVYYGNILVSALAANTPQKMTIILTVLTAGTNPGPELQPTGLIFTGVVGAMPGSQNVLVNNLMGQADSFLSTSINQGEFSYQPTSATVQPNQPQTIVVSPDLSNVSAGQVVRDSIFLQFSDGTPAMIGVLTVVAPAGTVADAESGLKPAASGCSYNTNLEIQFRSPQASPTAGFSATLGQPVTVQVQVADACANLQQSGSVTATFSNGDPKVSLTNIGNGVWTGTWRPVSVPPGGSSVSPVTLQVNAFEGQGTTLLTGVRSLSGSLNSASTTPIVTAGGVVNAATDQAVPVAPGSLITIYGLNLADGAGSASALPLPPSLNNAQVSMGNLVLPLLYTSAGQINVQMPFDVPINTQYQITVQHDAVQSVPEQLVIAAAQPGIFTINQQGVGQGTIVRQDGVTLAQPGNPADIGETVVIYCTGLGAVMPVVPAGAAAPSSPLSKTASPVTVQIGGQPAVVSFAGLTPGSAGLYQINAVVPSGITTGDAVQVIISVAGQTSPPGVTMAVR